MPRPRKCRRVCQLPENRGFLPVNPGSRQEPVILNIDEFEALRLIDREGLSQEECGSYMDVARTTVQQIYSAARKKIADALCEGRPLKIEGGDYRLCSQKDSCPGCSGCPRRPVGKTHRKEDGPMKIAIPLDENRQDVCPVLARAPYFLFAEGNQTEILENPAAQSQGGAGLKAAQFLVDQQTDVILTVRCGQNSADVFAAAEIGIYKTKPGSASENLRAFQEGKLEKLDHFHAGFQGIS